MNIDALLDQFKTVEELRIYCGSQLKQIQNLQKEVKELKEKILEASKSAKELIKKEFANPALMPNDFKILDDAKTISQIQLNMLKDVSFDRELTTDEAKRVELYNRILKEDNTEEKKTLKAQVEVLHEKELLSLVE